MIDFKKHKYVITRLLSVIIIVALINSYLPFAAYGQEATSCLAPMLEVTSSDLPHILRAWTKNEQTPVREVVIKHRPTELREVYKEFFSGETEVDRNLTLLGRELEPHKRLVVLSATAYGGGVAEIMHFLIPLQRDFGVRVDWYILETLDEYNYKDERGNLMNKFYDVTKKLHNGAQGQDMDLTPEEKEIYQKTMEHNYARLKHILENPEHIFFIEDFQPAGLIPKIRASNKDARIIFRLHIDTWGMRNNEKTKEQFGFLLDDINKADAIVTHIPEFAEIPGLKIPRYYMPPSIDILNEKNRDLTEDEWEIIPQRIKDVNGKSIDFNKKMILCVSRADPWKGQLELIERFEKLQQEGRIDDDTLLVMVSNFADDDPEGARCFNEMVEKSKTNPRIHVCTFKKDENNLNVNFLQRKARVVAQLSEREGFGLVIAEALWKGTPVICYDRGGMTQQVVDGFNGFVIKRDGPDYRKQVEEKLTKVLNFSDKERAEMGEYGKLVVAEKFTITSEAVHRLVLALAELDQMKNEEPYAVGDLAQEFIAKKRKIPPLKLVWERGRIIGAEYEWFIENLHQYFDTASKNLSEDHAEVDLNAALNFINIYIVESADYPIGYVPEEYKCGYCVESGKIFLYADELKNPLTIETLVENLKFIVELYNTTHHLKHPDTRLRRLDICIKKFQQAEALLGETSAALINQAI